MTFQAITISVAITDTGQARSRVTTEPAHLFLPRQGSVRPHLFFLLVRPFCSLKGFLCNCFLVACSTACATHLLQLVQLLFVACSLQGLLFLEYLSPPEPLLHQMCREIPSEEKSSSSETSKACAWYLEPLVGGEIFFIDL